MKFPSALRSGLAAWAVLALLGCEKPEMRSVAEPEKEPSLEDPEKPAPASAASTASTFEQTSEQTSEQTAPTAEEEVEAAVPVAPAEPELLVEKQGDRIVIAGAIKSRIQQERIVEQLTRAFPNLEVESRLEVDYDRYPVGWGGRITDEFLVPYFRDVENPVVGYKQGIVTLKGTVKQRGDIVRLTEMGITAFSGALSQDVDNQLKVGQ
ncbi:MAG: hypothetical protein WD342_10590 [Verrucomicrobiales bacterium]